jgi:hypothetical protein
VIQVLKQLFLIKYTALRNAGMLQLKKRLLRGISFLGLVAEQEKLESARHAIKTYQFITMTRFVVNA